MGLFALARIERERLRDALVQERVVAAETEGELQAAQAIQLGMVPPRDRLRHSIRASISMPCWNLQSRSAVTITTSPGSATTRLVCGRGCHWQRRSGSPVHGNVEGSHQCCPVEDAGRPPRWRPPSIMNC